MAMTTTSKPKPKVEKYVDSLLQGVPTVDVNSPSLKQKQTQFLEAFQSNMGITKTALLSVGVTEEEYAKWLEDETFKKALQSIKQTWIEQLRKAAYLRAQGKSDVLLMFLLKALDPDTFDEDVRKENHRAQNAPNAQNTPVRATLVRDNTIQMFLKGEEPEAEEPEPEAEGNS